MKSILFFIVIFFASCDAVYNAKINNQSLSDVQVSVIYDRNVLDSAYKGKPYFSYLRSRNDKHTTLVSFDSVQLRADYIIPKDQQLTIEHGLGSLNGAPSFNIIQEIIIRKGSGTVSYTHDMLSAVFKEINSHEWELRLQ